MKLTAILILFSLAASGQVIETYKDGSIIFKHGKDTLYGITKEQVYKLREMQLKKDSIENENEILNKQVNNLNEQLDNTQSIVNSKDKVIALKDEQIQHEAAKTEMWKQNAEDNNTKLKRNRKGFAISAGLILARLGIRLGIGI